MLSSKGYREYIESELTNFLMKAVNVTYELVQQWHDLSPETTANLDREVEIRIRIITALAGEYPFVEIEQVKQILFDFLRSYSRR